MIEETEEESDLNWLQPGAVRTRPTAGGSLGLQNVVADPGDAPGGRAYETCLSAGSSALVGRLGNAPSSRA